MVCGHYIYCGMESQLPLERQPVNSNMNYITPKDSICQLSSEYLAHLVYHYWGIYPSQTYNLGCWSIWVFNLILNQIMKIMSLSHSHILGRCIILIMKIKSFKILSSSDIAVFWLHFKQLGSKVTGWNPKWRQLPVKNIFSRAYIAISTRKIDFQNSCRIFSIPVMTGFNIKYRKKNDHGTITLSENCVVFEVLSKFLLDS